jgi:molecular chaperone GrpE
VALIHKQLAESLGRAGLETIEALGEPFDPLYHDGVATEPTDACEPNTVLEVIQKGYKLSGRVLRPAIVRVSAPPRGAQAGDAGAADGEGDQGD